MATILPRLIFSFKYVTFPKKASYPIHTHFLSMCEHFPVGHLNYVWQTRSLSSGETNNTKGTVQRDFLTPFFFIIRLLLVPLDMPRSDFEFFRIFVEIFVFEIYSPLSMTAGSQKLRLRQPIVLTLWKFSSWTVLYLHSQFFAWLSL